jgi:hypothetical protein
VGRPKENVEHVFDNLVLGIERTSTSSDADVVAAIGDWARVEAAAGGWTAG